MDSKKEQLIGEIEQISKSVAKKANLLDEQLSERYTAVKHTLDKTLSTVTVATKALAPALLIRSNPWLATGTALVGGFFIARKLTRDRSARRREQDRIMPYDPNAYDSETAVETEWRPRYVPLHAPERTPTFLQRHPNEVRAVKNLALTALTRFAANKLRAKMPHLADPISMAEVSVTSLLK